MVIDFIFLMNIPLVVVKMIKMGKQKFPMEKKVEEHIIGQYRYIINYEPKFNIFMYPEGFSISAHKLRKEQGKGDTSTPDFSVMDGRFVKRWKKLSTARKWIKKIEDEERQGLYRVINGD